MCAARTKGTGASDCELWRGVPSFAVASVLPAARDRFHQHAVAAITVHAYTGGDLDRRQLRRERADRDREGLGGTKRVLHVQVEAVRRPPAKQ